MAREPIILAIDPSLKSTGYAYTISNYPYSVGHGRVTVKKLKGCERLQYLKEALEDLLALYRPEFVVYEDYSFGSKGRSTYGIAELGGILRLELYNRGLDVLFVPPTSLKVFTTNDGFADKDTMIAAVRKKYNIAEDIGDDAADAIALWGLARAYLGLDRARTKRKRDTLTKCKLVKGKE